MAMRRRSTVAPSCSGNRQRSYAPLRRLRISATRPCSNWGAAMRRDGREMRRAERLTADVVVVGSGPAGSAVALRLAEAGVRTIVVEEGHWFDPARAPLDHARATREWYRDHGFSATIGRLPTPFLQGRAVGGTSVVNGAISWRLPEDVRAGWVAADPALAEVLDREVLERRFDWIEARLGIVPTDDAVAGVKNHLMARGADALGLEHRPIRRNVRACQGSGRCMQGCPNGAKQSMDRTLLADAEQHGAQILSGVRIERVRHRRGRVAGVTGRSAAGARIDIEAPRVVLAASAVQTPALLMASGLREGPVGRHFMCHPGASVAGRFAEPVRMWEGATQGHEVIGLRHEGLKFEALGFDLSILASRMPGGASDWQRRFAEMAHVADWGVAIRSRSEGRVRRMGGKARVVWSPSAADAVLFRRGVAMLGRLFLAAGAEHVHLGVAGWNEEIHDETTIDRFEQEGPRDPRAYTSAVTHMFGTARMAGDPRRGVVGPDYRHHHCDGLYVADSSIFPTNTGVNPQTSIIALALGCGDAIVQQER
ncbi:MAG: FAD-dependent oxidoreductase [Candidatus Dadabacteria bacterium]|nr:MAG: FAD-dependent oxidoreductase [Candidatus Dadabacteria bacterium]